MFGLDKLTVPVGKPPVEVIQVVHDSYSVVQARR